METLKRVAALILGGALVLGLLLALGAIIRFSVISPRRTRGARGRLRQPDPAAVESVCGFTPGAELLEFYRTSPLIDLTEFTLQDSSRTPAARWFIMGFEPLAEVDQKEWRAATRCPGILLATGEYQDGFKGFYFVDREGAVRFRPQRGLGEECVVATTIAEFAKFGVNADDPDDE